MSQLGNDFIGMGYTPPPAGGYAGAGGSTGSSSGSSQSQGQQSTQMIPGMLGIYSQLLGQNQAHYGNVLNAYQQGQGNLGSNLPGVYAGYGGVQSDVNNTLGMGQVLGKNGNWGVAAPAAQAIGQTFQQTEAQNTQNMANAGLGNTTVGANLQNQAALQAGQAYGGLGAQLAQTAAGYQAQIGQAQLGARMQGLGMQTGLTQAGLGPLGQQMGNTAGSLTGGFGSSSGSSNQSSSQRAQGPPPSGQGAGPGTGGGGAGEQGGYGGSMGGGGYPMVGAPGSGPSLGSPGSSSPSSPYDMGNFPGNQGGPISSSNPGGYSYGQTLNFPSPGQPGTGITGSATAGTNAPGGGFQVGQEGINPPSQGGAGDAASILDQARAEGQPIDVVGPKNIAVPRNATPEQKAQILQAHGINPNDSRYK